MSFKQFPQIDQASVNSARAENALESFFSQANGFISRKESPDKGCDYDAELIIDDTNAYNWRFGIQLKSIEKLRLTGNRTLISYAFKTSRLNYLLNRPVGDGLIVIFDDESGSAYFDYAQAIYKRLNTERGSELWHENETVNIHIPVVNLLNAESVKEIHQWFAQNFSKASFILRSQGPRYNYPVIPSQDEEFDINNPEKIKDLLLRYGFTLMRAHDLALLYDMIKAIPTSTLDQHPELLIMAAIVFGEIGARYDSQHIIQKLKRRSLITDEHLHLIRLTELKNRFGLGEMDIKEFIDELKIQRQFVSSPQNQLALDMTIILHELLMPKFYHPLPSGIYERIRLANERIKTLEIDQQSKQQLEVWHTENLASLIAFYRLKQLNQLAIQRSMGFKNRTAELVKESNMLADLQKELHSELERLFKVGQGSDDKLLQAYVIMVRASYVLAQEIDVISQMPVLDDIKFHTEQMFLNTITLSLQAVDLFRDLNFLEPAYRCLYYGIELLTVSRQVHRYTDYFDLDLLYKLKKDMEQKWDLRAYDFVVPGFIEKQVAENELQEKKPMIVTRDLDDEQLLNMAKTFCQAIDLPHQSLRFVMDELKGYRTFYRYNTDGYEIKRAPLIPFYEREYQQPVKFIIRNLATGIFTFPIQDVEAQLKLWGLTEVNN
ncbi:hypothetical protein DJ568_02800 [Mucilaginibacter hurinus]|uniref:DUF4365 domain-containing protein n=1 Tax=Mucilaginibacter hurinus TaxID=2201324 RepID=A0A367GTR6_9SPHI|nr:DUF4365 domain-containing protein [Mucilaginibacter hurinus]RCH56802.1 hypothetical protein DJ568_02800 [Mucilaginibacter hurinus]